LKHLRELSCKTSLSAGEVLKGQPSQNEPLPELRRRVFLATCKARDRGLYSRSVIQTEAEERFPMLATREQDRSLEQVRIEINR
jgi:hypothetical protein